jgi:S-adenosylmethionine:tRNA ribosyltransferase-isomerase
MPERTSSRLLCLTEIPFEYRELRFGDLADLFEPGDLLILNDTRVIPARLFGKKPTGGKLEILLERIVTPERALVQIRSSGALEPGTWLELEGNTRARITERQGGFFVLEFDQSVGQLLDAHGHVPLPPYIRRTADRTDRERYQTVYARSKGAVAAPTAGLHFDETLLERLQAGGIELQSLTLHVGAGTFQPVRQEQFESARLHPEYMEVSPLVCQAVAAARARGGRVIATGTTVVRALETAARSGELQAFSGQTDLFITPGFRFNVVDAMITNFHLPRSSLLMLVCAFRDKDEVLDAYVHAVSHGFRFYSYGDAMFLTKEP